jgi:hypothetical protein
MPKTRSSNVGVPNQFHRVLGQSMHQHLALWDYYLQRRYGHRVTTEETKPSRWVR